jgi:hypothetical protein
MLDLSPVHGIVPSRHIHRSLFADFVVLPHAVHPLTTANLLSRHPPSADHKEALQFSPFFRAFVGHSSFADTASFSLYQTMARSVIESLMERPHPACGASSTEEKHLISTFRPGYH